MAKKPKELTEVEIFFINNNEMTAEQFASKLGCPLVLIEEQLKSKSKKSKKTGLDDYGRHETRKEVLVVTPNAANHEPIKSNVYDQPHIFRPKNGSKAV